MQRAASSDTLSTMALGSDDGQPRRTLHDTKLHLCHSQSMFLPENGKVRSGTQSSRVFLAETKIESQRMYKSQPLMFPLSPAFSGASSAESSR